MEQTVHAHFMVNDDPFTIKQTTGGVGWGGHSLLLSFLVFQDQNRSKKETESLHF